MERMEGGFRETSPPTQGLWRPLLAITTGTAFNRVPCPPHPGWGMIFICQCWAAEDGKEPCALLAISGQETNFSN